MNTWIWEHQDYPDFPYDAEEIIDEVAATAQSIGKLLLIIKMLDMEKEQKIKIYTSY